MRTASLPNSLNSLTIKHHELSDLWHFYAACSNIFDDLAPFYPEPPSKDNNLYNFTDKKLPHLHSNMPLVSNKYFPIELFKNSAEEFFAGQKITKVFRSSGTTQESRSTSMFSKDGLMLYKAESLLIFDHVLRSTMGSGSQNIRGFSLIPSAKTWPESSLAQMLEWISEFWSLQFINEQDIYDIPCSEPVWIFGTALQFVKILKEHRRANKTVRLHPQSLLIETGGLKSSDPHQKFNKAEFYTELSTTFSLSTNRIVSEYGMSELACQAYDWVPHTIKHEVPLANRSFKFPAWTNTHVMLGLGKAENSGVGALTVYDPFRIDYPWPIRTQDICDISARNTFKYLERVSSAPLKGCSIAVEDVLRNVETLAPTTQIQRDGVERKASIHLPAQSEIGCEDLKQRITQLKTFLNDFLDSDLTTKLLSQDLESSSLATLTISDIKHSLPKTDQDWLTAICTSTGGKDLSQIPHQWCFILPSNQPIVGLYPLSFAYLCDFSLYVKLSNRVNSLFIRNFIDKIQNNLQDFDIHLLPDDFDITSTKIIDRYKAILMYGNSKTIDTIQKAINIPVKGFGSSVAISITNLQRLQVDALNIVKDAFSLNQKGCMSSRLLILDLKEGDVIDPKNIHDILIDASKQFITHDLGSQIRLSLDHLEVHLHFTDTPHNNRTYLDEPLFPVYFEADIVSSNKILSENIYTLPILCVNNKRILTDLPTSLDYLTKLLQLPEINLVLVPHNTNLNTNLLFCELKYHGTANQPAWNGLHQKISLFEL